MAYFEPQDTPPEIRAYSRQIRQLAVGSPGKLGGLKLKLLRDSSGKTVIGDLWKQVPLQVLRPFYYDPNQPEMAILYIMNPTGGVLQGDRLRLDISLDKGARAHLTTQAATKIYRMNADYATQIMNIDLGAGSYLEYLPDQTIPYAGSRFYQEVNVRMRPDSSFLYWEILTPGRNGREHFEYDVFYSKLEVEGRLRDPLLSDTIVLEPRSSALTREGIMARHGVLGNFYAISKSVDEGLASKIHEKTRSKRLMVGVSPASMVGGVVARVLGPSSRLVRNVLEAMWSEARIAILGSPAPRIRK